MKIPGYARQVIRQAVPSVAPTPIFEAERSSLQGQQNIFGIRGNLKRISLNHDLQDKQFDLKHRQMDLQQQQMDLQRTQNDINTGLKIAGLVLEAGKFAFNIYEAHVQTETAKAIEAYKQDASLYDEEIMSKAYALGDVDDIDMQFANFMTDNHEWRVNESERVLENIENPEIRERVETYIKYDNEQRLQRHQIKFEEVRKGQMTSDMMSNIDSAASRGDYEAVDTYLRLGIESNFWTPAQADEIDAQKEKSIVSNQLARGINSIFQNGGDLKQARDFIMGYDPAISGKQNYTLSTEDRENFYKQVETNKKINDVLEKERIQKLYTAETNRLMDKYINGDLTISDITSSRLPEAKAEGYESQFSQKYFLDLLEKKADKATSRKSDQAVLSQLYLGLEDTARTYYENYTDILKAFGDGSIINSDYRTVMSMLDDTTAGQVVKSGAKTLGDAYRDLIFDDSEYNLALEEYWDDIKSNNYDSAAIAAKTQNLIVKYGRENGMKWLGVQNEGAGLFKKNDPDIYLESHHPEEVQQEVYERQIAEQRARAQENLEAQIQKESIATRGRPMTDSEMTAYKASLVRSEYNSGESELEDYDIPNDFKLVNSSNDNDAIGYILSKFNLNIDVSKIFRKSSRDSTTYLFQDNTGNFYYSAHGKLMSWDPEAGEWTYL